MHSSPPALFSPRRQEAQADRVRAQGDGPDFLADIVTESLQDRLAMVTRRFARALLIAPPAHPLARILPSVADRVEHSSSFDAVVTQSASFDLIVWPCGLDSIDDVPGALVRARRLLQPDGLLTGALVGDGSLPLLRHMLASEGMRAIPRMHPQIDLKSFGNLLQRTGYALPVADVEALTLRYQSWRDLIRDLRRAGLSSQLASPPPPLTRGELGALDRAFAAASGADARADEVLRLIFFSGWAPHPEQPKAARRGSATGSLAAALRAISTDDQGA